MVSMRRWLLFAFFGENLMLLVDGSATHLMLDFFTGPSALSVCSRIPLHSVYFSSCCGDFSIIARDVSVGLFF
jgi:hypothetical protein